MITTVPVTMRVNKQVVARARAEATKSNKFYQTVLNEKLAKAYGVKLPEGLPNKKVTKVKDKRLKGAKPKKAAKVLKRPKTKFKLKK